MTGINLVVADRSASVRAVIRRLVEIDDISVVGETHDGHEVVELLRKTAADGLVTDLDLDGLAGHELVAAVAGVRPIPIFVLTPEIRTSTTHVAFGAQELGVVAVYQKPGLPEGWVALGESLRSSICEVWAAARSGGPAVAEPDDTPVIGPKLRYVAVGASAGGPGALCQLLRALGTQQRFGIAVVQHIAAGFEAVLGEWLAAETGLDVAVAADGEQLAEGRVRLAPAGGHTCLGPDGSLRVVPDRPESAGRGPSVATLFESLLLHRPEAVAAVVLSGMGSDGAEAMGKLKHAGVLTMAQDRDSCAVYGMPRVAVEAGAVTLSLSPTQIGTLLSRVAGAGQ